MRTSNSNQLRRLMAGMAAMVAGVASATAGADVTIEERISVDGFGPAKIGAMDGTTATAIASDKARVDSQIQFKSRLLRAFGGNGATAQIIRLDNDRMYDLDMGKKQYTETSFEDIRTNIDAALTRVEGQEVSTSPSGAPVNEAQCDWSPARAEVTRSGARAQLAGFDTEQATITVSQTCTDRETRAACDYVYSIDQWLSASLPGGEQAQAFWKAYAQKMGAEEMVSALQMRSQQVLSRYKDGWSEALKNAGELQGYPLKTTFTMQVGGPNCTQAAGATLDGSGTLPDAGQAAADAGAQSAASAATSVAAQKAAEEAGGGVTGGIAGSAAGAFGGTLASGLLNRMRKRDPAPAPTAAAPEPPANGMVQLFRMSSETTAVRETSVPAERFEIPAGFSRIQN